MKKKAEQPNTKKKEDANEKWIDNNILIPKEIKP